MHSVLLNILAMGKKAFSHPSSFMVHGSWLFKSFHFHSLLSGQANMSVCL